MVLLSYDFCSSRSLRYAVGLGLLVAVIAFIVYGFAEKWDWSLLGWDVLKALLWGIIAGVVVFAITEIFCHYGGSEMGLTQRPTTAVFTSESPLLG